MRLISKLLALTLIAGCQLADEDRCPDNLVYLPENQVCACPEGTVYDPASDDCIEEEDSETDTETDTGTDIDGGPDDGGPDTDTGTGTDTGESGYGEPCKKDADCEEFADVDFCALNPLMGKGYCTIENCESGDCPPNWQCCDCSSLLGWIACLDDEYAKEAAAAGCTCEG